MELTSRHDWVQGIYDLEEFGDETKGESQSCVYGRQTLKSTYMSAWALVGSTAMTSAKPPLGMRSAGAAQR